MDSPTRPCRRTFLTGIVSFSLLTACASTSTAPADVKPKAAAPEEALAYFPLEQGWKWAYDITSEGSNVLAVYSVLEVRTLGADRFVVVSAGEERIGYEVLATQGIRRKQGAGDGDFVIKNPVRKGSVWDVSGGQARIVAIGETVETPAGRYENCATVEENRTDPDRVVRTVFAPGVGPIRLEQQVYDSATGKYTTTLKAELRGLTRPGDDPLGGN